MDWLSQVERDYTIFPLCFCFPSSYLQLSLPINFHDPSKKKKIQCKINIFLGHCLWFRLPNLLIYSLNFYILGLLFSFYFLYYLFEREKACMCARGGRDRRRGERISGRLPTEWGAWCAMCGLILWPSWNQELGTLLALATSAPWAFYFQVADDLKHNPYVQGGLILEENQR